MRKVLWRKQGFTLVELVVVISIVSIATTLMLVSVTSQREVRAVERSSREVASAIRETQSYALAGRTVSGENNCWIGFRVPAAGSAYSIIHQYPTGTCGTTGTITSYTLKEGVSFSGFGTPANIWFTLPRAELGSDMSLTGGAYRIGLSRGSTTYYVCVYPTGRVVENLDSSTCP